MHVARHVAGGLVFSICDQSFLGAASLPGRFTLFPSSWFSFPFAADQGRFPGVRSDQAHNFFGLFSSMEKKQLP